MVINVEGPATGTFPRESARGLRSGFWGLAELIGGAGGESRASSGFKLGEFLSADADTFLRGQKQPSGE